jgi:acyl-CoA reductase-like NAD-dependent aldehyde dehydrogenase
VPLKLRVLHSKNGDGHLSRSGRSCWSALADILERRRYELSAVEVFEVGKPWSEADGDIREAIDFCTFLRAANAATRADQNSRNRCRAKRVIIITGRAAWRS